MSTNPDTITGADLDTTANTAGIPMDRHFEAAGIEPEPSDDSKAQNAGAEGGEGDKDKGGQSKQESDKKPEAGKEAGAGDAKDDKSKQSPDDKGKENKEQALAPGDLKLPDGSVVKAGAERRHYETARLAQQRVADLDNQLKQMTSSRDKHRDELVQLRNTVAQVNGAQPEELQIGTQLVRDLKRDPAGTLKTLLAEALASGIPIEGIASGLDTAAITQLIESKLGNVQQQQGPTQEEITAEAARATTEFFSQFPDARIHEPVLARVLIDHPQLELRDAYYQLQQSFINNGYDWSKPLAEQVQARESNQQQQQPNGQQQQDNTKPMPNGRGAVDGVIAADKTTVAHESMDTGDIIKEAMREAGLKI